MNKRIQKKMAKRLEHEAEQLAAEAPAITGHDVVPRALKLMRSTAAEVEQSLRKGEARKAARIVQKRAGEAISQVTGDVNALISDKREQLKEKFAVTEEQAESLLKKLPMVGEAAAKKLHDVTHR